MHHICEKTGRSFLQTYLWACKKVDIELLVKVISKDKVDVRHVAKNGKTAMYFACCNSEKTLEVLKLMNSAGADVVQCTSEGQDSLAVYRSQVLPPDPQVVIWLFAMGCQAKISAVLAECVQKQIWNDELKEYLRLWGLLQAKKYDLSKRANRKTLFIAPLIWQDICKYSDLS